MHYCPPTSHALIFSSAPEPWCSVSCCVPRPCGESWEPWEQVSFLPEGGSYVFLGLQPQPLLWWEQWFPLEGGASCCPSLPLIPKGNSGTAEVSWRASWTCGFQSPKVYLWEPPNPASNPSYPGTHEDLSWSSVWQDWAMLSTLFWG